MPTPRRPPNPSWSGAVAGPAWTATVTSAAERRHTNQGRNQGLACCDVEHHDERDVRA